MFYDSMDQGNVHVNDHALIAEFASAGVAQGRVEVAITTASAGIICEVFADLSNYDEWLEDQQSYYEGKIVVLFKHEGIYRALDVVAACYVAPEVIVPEVTELVPDEDLIAVETPADYVRDDAETAVRIQMSIDNAHWEVSDEERVLVKLMMVQHDIFMAAASLDYKVRWKAIKAFILLRDEYYKI